MTQEILLSPSTKTSLSVELTNQVINKLRDANAQFIRHYPGDSFHRQPVHTVYGGAQIFKADSAQKLGTAALNVLTAEAPHFVTFAQAIGLQGSSTLPSTAQQIVSLEKRLKKNPQTVKTQLPSAWLAHIVYSRVLEKLTKEPVEDYRIDFEDGYGNRPDSEEDHQAAFAAEEVARGMEQKSLPPFIGIRIKPFTEDLKARSVRTLDIFLSTLLGATRGSLPDGFVVTLPKVTTDAHVEALVALFSAIEKHHQLPEGTLKLEIMVETPQSIITPEGSSALPLFAKASGGRCIAAHFGVYDYTASTNITAAYQTMGHPACDFARHMMVVAFAGTGITLSDGATNIMPVGPYRAVKGHRLSAREKKENRVVVQRAWKMGFDDIQHSLQNGFYQGWDLHPAQLPVRYAAVYSFFLSGLDAAAYRLKSFMEKAAQASLVGDIFDDAATGQGLLNFFLRGINCRAITEEEATVTGLSVNEIRTRSFVKILGGRRVNR